jgi:hypothetical protein
LEQLNAEAFKIETLNFRHQLQHRFRLHFDTGMTTCFERAQKDEGVTYAFKALPPLQVDTLIPELYEQHGMSAQVFKAYWLLLCEFCAAWDTPNS